MQIHKTRVKRLENKTQPKTGLLPLVCDDSTQAAELMRMRQQNPGRKVFRFSDSVDHFV